MMVVNIHELSPRLPAMPVQNVELFVNRVQESKKEERRNHGMILTSQQGLQDVGPTLCDACSDKHLIHRYQEPVASRSFRC